MATSDKVDVILGGFGSSIVFAASTAELQHPSISGADSPDPIFERGFNAHVRAAYRGG